MPNAAKARPLPIVRSDQLRPFALFQTAMWSLFATTAMLPAMAVPQPWGAVARWLAGWTVLGLAVSTLVAIVLVRLPDRGLRGFRALLLIISVAASGGLLWTAALWALEPLLGREPFAPAHATDQQHLALSFVRASFLLWLWTALFLVNLLSIRVQRAKEHSVRALAAADRAQLQLLRSQLHPHFLFNALNSVVALIGENPQAAQAMVRDIAALLRLALDSDGSRDARVKDELEFVRLYLKCEKVRFEERLQVTFDVAEGVEALRMPPMLFQPLVENAVKHGLAGAAEGPLAVRVTVRRGGAGLSFEVANTGSLRQLAQDALGPPSTGIGLRNVQERLAHLFPERHRFELVERDGWVIASFELPVQEVCRCSGV